MSQGCCGEEMSCAFRHAHKTPKPAPGTEQAFGKYKLLQEQREGSLSIPSVQMSGAWTYIDGLYTTKGKLQNKINKC